MDEFGDVFKGVGLLPVYINPSAVPVFYSLCFAWSPARGSTDHAETKDYDKSHWVNSMAGKLRVFVDSKDLNKVIKWPHYPLPTLDDVTYRLAGTCYFSIMDASSGYWALKLTKKSSKLTTFNIEFGLQIPLPAI